MSTLLPLQNGSKFRLVYSPKYFRPQKMAAFLSFKVVRVIGFDFCAINMDLVPLFLALRICHGVWTRFKA